MNQSERAELRDLIRRLEIVTDDLGHRAEAMPGDLVGARQVLWARTRVSLIVKDLRNLVGGE